MRKHSWRHGWVPLTTFAALQKAHGSKRRAARLLGHKTTSAVSRHVNKTSARRKRK